MRVRLGVLLSGRGSNFLAILNHIRKGRLQASIACVVSDTDSAPGLQAARQAGIPAFFVDPAGRKRGEFEEEMVACLAGQGAQVVCLAGFMRILGKRFLAAFPGRIINIHPSLLPAFPGLHAQRQALDYGVRYAGCTVHLVDAGVDSGPVLAQAVVPVLPDDTEDSLSNRILEMEHDTYWRAIRDFTENKEFA